MLQFQVEWLEKVLLGKKHRRDGCQGLGHADTWGKSITANARDLMGERNFKEATGPGEQRGRMKGN